MWICICSESTTKKKQVVLRVCGIKTKKVNKKNLFASVIMFLFSFFFYFVLFFYLMMYVCIWLSTSAYVCMWLILYIWCSLQQRKSRRCPHLIFVSSFSLSRPGVSTCGRFQTKKKKLYQRMILFLSLLLSFLSFFFSDCWMWFYWERSSVDWLFFVRVNLKRKRKKAILFNFLCCWKKV